MYFMPYLCNQLGYKLELFFRHKGLHYNGEFKMREIKLCMQVLQAARCLSRAEHAEPCHWSEGCNNNVGGHCRKGEPQRKLC